MNSLHLIMPMGGSGSRFSEEGFEMPKPLIPIWGKPFFYWATQSVRKFVPLESLTFVILEEHIKRFDLDKEILRYFPEASIRVLDHVLNGAVLTCLEGIKAISNDSPVLFNDCDHIFLCRSFNEYCSESSSLKADGALLTFKSNDPKFSFLEMNPSGEVVGTVEKVAVSDHAICGAYYFRNRALFEEAVHDYLKACTYKEFFISGVFNILAKKGYKIRNFDVDMHLPFGTPEEYKIALNSKEYTCLL